MPDSLAPRPASRKGKPPWLMARRAPGPRLLLQLLEHHRDQHAERESEDVRGRPQAARMAADAMATRSSDTSPDTERVQLRILRAMPPWRRLAQVDGLWAVTTELAMADLRRQHPAATGPELRALLSERVRLAWHGEPQRDERAGPGDARER